MTAPLLTASVERLAAEVYAGADAAGTRVLNQVQSRILAERLIRSGVVVPAASLADDDALVVRVRSALRAGGVDADRDDAENAIRVLAAALEGR